MSAAEERDFAERIAREVQLGRVILNRMPSDILRDLFVERARQEIQWGGQATDDTRSPADWLAYINKQGSLAHVEQADEEKYRARMLKIAALALAAVESRERVTDNCKCQLCEIRRTLARHGDEPMTPEALVELLALFPGLGRPRAR